MNSLAPIDPPPAAGPVLIGFDTIEPKHVEWLWPDRVALGKLTLLTGDPGLGKSFITLDMAARVSSGLPWPDMPSTSAVRGGVVLLSAEDDPADTIRPRLDALGADPAQIKLLTAVRRETSQEGNWGAVVDLREEHIDLSKHIPEIESAIHQTPDCRLVIIDPISAYLGCTDSHRDAALRGVLSPVANLAAKHHVAVVLVAHLNKSGGGKAIYRSSGSIAFIAAARSAWMVTKDKDDASRRLMLPLKNNLGPDVMGLAYTIAEVPGTDGSVVVWDQEPVSLSADEALSELFIGGSDEQHDEVMEWVSEALAGSEGVHAAAMLEQAKANGFTAKAARKALKALGGRSLRKGFAEEGTWFWSLPRGADMPIDAIDSKPPQTGINDDNGNQ